MTNSLRNVLLISVPLALLALPARASESESGNAQPDLFRALGDFVIGGLGPARTMEDIQREEREARAKALAASRKADGEVSEETAPTQAPAAQSVAAPMLAPSVPPAAVKMAKVEPTKSVPAEAKPAEPVTPVVAHVPADIIPPPPKARPQVEARALPAAPAIPAEPLKSHIAATASVDQALKLGGPAQIYKRRLAVD